MLKAESNQYSVGQIAEYFGVSKDTIRLYDKIGILTPKKNRRNGYRVYDRADFICMDYIMRLRSLGMPLADIKIMINNCTIEHAEAVMQVQEKIIEKKIEELENLQLMVRDYQKSFSKAIQTMGNITIEKSEPLIYMEVKESMKEVMSDFTKLTVTHVPKFTFVAEKERFFDDHIWSNFLDIGIRRDFFKYAITLVDDEHFAKNPNFQLGKFQIIPSQKCVHAILKAYTGKDYNDFIRCKDYIKANKFQLGGDPIFRTLSVRNNSCDSVDYYEFWAPIE